MSDFLSQIESVTLEGRVLAESLMTATCTMRRATGDTAIDPATDSEVFVFEDLFSSACKIQTRNLQAREEQVGARTAVTVVVELHLPIDAPLVAVGDVAEIVSVSSIADPQMVGRKFTVVGPVAKNFMTARRLEVTGVVS